MDFHSALAALMQPMAFASLPMTSLQYPSGFLGLTQNDQPIMPIPTVPENTMTPKKSRIEDSSSPLSSHGSTVSSTQLSTPLGSPRRKQPQAIPDEKKDVAYFERRRKNNNAAKRSRDARRQKEEATSRKAQILEHENAQLRAQLTLLKSEMANIQIMMLTARASHPLVKREQTPTQLDV